MSQSVPGSDSEVTLHSVGNSMVLGEMEDLYLHNVLLEMV